LTIIELFCKTKTDRLNEVLDVVSRSDNLKTSISANADGPRDAASRKIDHNALPTK